MNIANNEGPIAYFPSSDLNILVRCTHITYKCMRTYVFHIHIYIPR